MEKIEVADYVSKNRAYKNLANAIVIQAVEDMRTVCEMPQIDEKNLCPFKHFFHSKWFELLSDLNGDLLYREILKEIFPRCGEGAGSHRANPIKRNCAEGDAP